MSPRRIDYEELHEEILIVAKRLFQDEGIVNTEMKDIAMRLGIGRSTLYRHYPSKESILFVLAQRTLEDILRPLTMKPDREFKTGMEEFEWLMRSFLDKMIKKRDEIVFLRDFDFYFAKGYPKISDASSYESYAQSANCTEGTLAVRRGIEDGSIANKGDARNIASTVVHSLLAMAQRVLPREEQFLRESGLSIEYLYFNLEILLDGIRA